MLQHADVHGPNPGPQVQMVEAILFVNEAMDSAADRLALLDSTLKRLGVNAVKQHTRVLFEEPHRAARCGVRFVPCIVLNTGSRLVSLYGNPSTLTGSDLESALARR
jgi:hypothetical protein